MLLLGLTQLIPAAIGLACGESQAVVFAGSGLASVAGGLLVRKFIPSEGRIGRRECFLIVVWGWLMAAAIGSVPFLVGGTFTTFTDAFFETMSGISTTGATLIPDIEAQPYSILFWRSFIQWLGGMGIIVLFVAVLPNLGGGARLFMAEVPGPVPERIQPRIQATAKTLWLIYVGLSGLLAVLLLAGGMSVFDSVTHTFTTMATGGFSTRQDSIGAFASPFIRITIMCFTLVAGCNFALYFKLLSGRPGAMWRDGEFRFYLTLVALATALLFVGIMSGGGMQPGPALLDSGFQAASIMTTTGFTTADYEVWPPLARGILLLLMFVGGCAGSTGGSIKVGRLLILFKHAAGEVSRFTNPRRVSLTKVNGNAIKTDVINAVLAFVFLYMLVFAVGTVIMAGLGLDLTTAAGAVAACLGNIGPGFGLVGPSYTYEVVPAVGKWVLALCMLLGRLEVYTVIALLLPGFWRRY